MKKIVFIICCGLLLFFGVCEDIFEKVKIMIIYILVVVSLKDMIDDVKLFFEKVNLMIKLFFDFGGFG